MCRLALCGRLCMAMLKKGWDAFALEINPSAVEDERYLRSLHRLVIAG